MARTKPAFHPQQIKPLTGTLDLRSLPENVVYGDYRWVENMAATSQTSACRRPGYQRLFAEAPGTYNNQDLHDQLFENSRQPLQLLYEATSLSGVHRLIAATQNRIYALDDSLGNWRILSDQLGGLPTGTCSSTQWKAAQVEDVLVFTNGYDQPQAWAFDGPALINQQSVSTLTDLTTLNITKVDAITSWKGVMFLANVVSDGVRVNHRILWSDFKKPLSFIPTAGSIAGFQDLGYGEDILQMLPLNDSLLIYTTRGIWECQVGDPTAGVFTFRQRYGERLGHGCLAYRNTLISTGSDHIYMGRDGIYVYNLYTPEPVRTDWIHKTSAGIFNEIDTSKCSLQFGGWNPAKQEAWFSWTKVGDNCPYRTLVINTQYRFADIVQRGFTAFGNWRPSSSQSVTDYLTQNCICEVSGLGILDGNSPLTGGTCGNVSPPDCNTTFNSIYTLAAKTVIGFSATLEDAAATADAGSLYTALNTITINDLCAQDLAGDQCNATQKFVFASAVDHCIKQYDGQYAHEHATSTGACATYANAGYDSILRSGPIDFGAASNSKFIRRMLVDYVAAEQLTPSSVVPRLGFSRQASDPNINGCPIMWQTLPAKLLQCASSFTESQHDANKTQPYLAMEWPTYMGGHFIYWEIKVSGTGGASCYSSITLDMTIKPNGV